MISDPDALLISIPFGVALETRQSPRYFWNCAKRGNEPLAILQWTLEGEGRFAFQGKEHPVRAGEAFIAVVPEKSTYYFPKEAQTPWKFAWLNIYGELGISLCRQFRNQFGPVMPLPKPSPAGSIFLRLTQLANAAKLPDPYETSAMGYRLLMEWSRQLTRPLYQRSDPIQVATAICASRFREPWGVKELADQTGLSREHFTRIFTQRTGQSPAGYLRRLRVDAAKEMIQSQNFPLTEVALRCGFSSTRSLRRALDDSV